LISKNRVLETIYSLHFKDKRFFAISLIIFAALMVDYYISSAIDTFKIQASSSWGMLLFSIIAIICILGQYIILFITRARFSEYKVIDSQIITLQKSMTIVVYLLTGLVAVNILQIYIFSQYYIHLISAVVIIAYGFTSILMGILAYKLLNWFKLRRSLVILIYGIAAVSFTINAVVSAILFEQLLLEKPLIFAQDSKVEYNFECNTNPFKCFIISFQTYTQFAYIIAMWCGSIILLHYNTKRIGKPLFWFLITVPILIFYVIDISAYDELYQMSSTINKKETPVVEMLLIVILTTFLGIINGIGFRSVGGFVKTSRGIREYMFIAAYGIVFYFIAANSSVAAAGNPPFGLVSISFVPLAAFLILVGLLNSAVSVAHNSELRREIKRSVIEDTKLLGSIGTAQWQQEIEMKVVKLTETITEKTGIEPSLSADEAKQYMNDVLHKLKKGKINQGESNL
jgi:hypothetical protein